MKKFAVIIYILAVILVGCSNDLPGHKTVDDFSDVTVIDSEFNAVPSFTATVIEVYDSNILVEPDEGTNERRSSDRIYVSTDIEDSDRVCEVKAGDRISVYYRGGIMETYPARLGNVVAIYLVDKDGNILPN